MNDLEVVTGLISQLASHGETIAIIWVSLHYGVKVLGILAFTGTVVTIAWLITRAITRAFGSQQMAKDLWREFIDAGSVPYEFTNYDARCLYRAIMNYKGKHDAGEKS